MAKDQDREQSFETSLASLEQIVAQLESGDLPLERSLELFEEGVGLARRCQSQLEDAERKVEMLLRERGEIKVVPFDAPKDAQSSSAAPPTTLAVASPHSKGSAIKSEEEIEDEEDLNDAVPF
jgi:exodeoxyribonuclease VII small subunit